MIAWFDAFGSTWVDVVVAASVQFALVVAVALLVDRALLRRAAPRTRVALWAAVLLPLAVPYRPEVAGIDVPWERVATSTPEARSAGPAPTRKPRPGIERRRQPSAKPEATSRRPQDRRREGREVVRASNDVAAAPVVDETTDQRVVGSEHDSAAAAPPGPWTFGPWKGALVALWFVGVLVLVLRALRAELHLRRVLTGAPEAPDRVQRLATEASKLAGLRRVPRAVRCDALASPAVHGIRRTRFLVPGSALALQDDELRAVLVHEAFHVRRHDLVWAPLVALLRALWWFHPLVAFASRSLADALEETRDHDALVALGTLDASATSPHSPARLAYARVLVRLAEARAEALAPSPSPAPAVAPGAIPLTRDGRGLTRRVAMIVSTPPKHRFAALGGIVLALGVTGLGLVRAGTDPIADGPTRVTGDHVGVERQSPMPAWRAEMDAKLSRRLETISFHNVDLVEAFHAVGEMVGVRVRVEEDAIYDHGDGDFDLDVTAPTGAELLDLLCLFCPDLYWSITNDAIRVGYGGSLPSSIDLRFYRVAPVFERRGIDDEDELISFVLEFGLGEGPDHRFQDSFEQEHWSIEMWRGLLAVRATEDGHRSIQTALDRVLNAQALPTRVDEPWRARIEAALDRRMDFEWDDMECDAALEQLSEILGVPVLHPFEDANDYGNTFSFNLEDVSARYVLDIIAEAQERQVTVADGAVLLTEFYDVEMRLHPISDLLQFAGAGDEEMFVDEMVEFIMGVDSESWDMDPRCMVTRLGDHMVIQQTAANHEQIAALLAQMERALGGD